MELFDGLPNPAAPALAFQQGLEHGQQQREERDVRAALGAYAVNPDDPQAFQALAQYRPEMAISIRQDQAKRQQQMQAADLQRRAAAGDRAAQAQLWGIAPDTADKLSDNARQEMDRRVGAIGQAGLRISQIPESERPSAWDAAVDQLSRDYPELAQFKGHYSPEALNSVIDQAKLVTEHFNLSRPSYMALASEDDLVNTRDPEAVRAVIAKRQGGAAPVQVRTPEEAHALPPGTQFIDPNGVHRVVPGGAGGNASGGFRP